MDNIIKLKEPAAGQELYGLDQERKACCKEDPLPSEFLSRQETNRDEHTDISQDLTLLYIPLGVRPEELQLVLVYCAGGSDQYCSGQDQNRIRSQYTHPPSPLPQEKEDTCQECSGKIYRGNIYQIKCVIYEGTSFSAVTTAVYTSYSSL